MDVFEKVLFAVAAVYTGYLALLSAAALLARRSPRGGECPRHRFAIVVPAHDEEAVLPGLLDGLQRLAYPRALRELVVIADNCRDGTAALARERGVRVLERTDPRRGQRPVPSRRRSSSNQPMITPMSALGPAWDPTITNRAPSGWMS